MRTKFKRFIYLILTLIIIVSSFGLIACEEDPDATLKDTPIKQDTNGGPLYTLQEAYDFGYIRGEALSNVAYYYSPGAYGQKNKDFVPMNLTPISLTSARETQITDYYIENVLGVTNVNEWDGYARAIYLGCYGNCYVVKMLSSNFVQGQGEIKEKIIGTERFYNYYPDLIYVWKTDESPRIESGVFYDLEYVYSKGMINKEQLRSIAYYYNLTYEKNFEDTNFQPISKLPEIITVALEQEIKQSYLKNVLDYPEGNIEMVNINGYFGCYNDYYVLSIADEYILYDLNVYETYEIDGVKFYNYHKTFIEVWIKL